MESGGKRVGAYILWLEGVSNRTERIDAVGNEMRTLLHYLLCFPFGLRVAVGLAGDVCGRWIVGEGALTSSRVWIPLEFCADCARSVCLKSFDSSLGTDTYH